MLLKTAEAGNTSSPQAVSLQGRTILLSAQDGIIELPLGSDFTKGVRKDPLESESVFPPKSK